MVLAIDGPAGVGKSTVSRKIAEMADFHYLNSGNFYRAVTLGAIRSGINRKNENDLTSYTLTMTLEYDLGRISISGTDVTDDLHSDQVDSEVAQVSTARGVREFVNDWLRKISHKTDIVVEGRDITTVVFPDAELKVFMDASPEIRAQRRFDQGVSTLTVEEIAEAIRQRDEIDRNKAWGSLKCPDDAFYLDTSGLTIEEVCDKVLRKIREIKQTDRGDRVK